MTTLAKEVVVKRLSKAFLPLKCGVELWDFDTKLRFAVYDGEARCSKNKKSCCTGCRTSNCSKTS